MMVLAWMLGCTPTSAVDFDRDGFAADVDCDDFSDRVNPQQPEIWYDGVDANCDGADDFDQDGDGVRAAAFGGEDCDDQNVEVASTPTTWWADCDGDGVAGAIPIEASCVAPLSHEIRAANPCGGGRFPIELTLQLSNPPDCDDQDVLIYPGRAETPYDGVDANCDGRNDYDADEDGYVAAGYAAHVGTTATQTGDCDDHDAQTHPGASDPLDGVDQDCDGVNEFDQDGDGFIAEAFGGTDCNDTDPASRPGLLEVACNGIDDDCDPNTNEAPDLDGDGYSCAADCDDGDPGVHIDAIEVCDGADQNCDGVADDGVTEVLYLDADGDGVGFGASLLGCMRPGFSTQGDDCNDAQVEQYPGNPEVCDGLDNDCDGQVDQGLPLFELYVDLDGDGMAGTSVGEACAALPGTSLTRDDCVDSNAALSGPQTQFADCDGDGYGGETLTYCDASELDERIDALCPGGRPVLIPGDCDDTTAAVRPLLPDLCNGIDDDCDGTLDEDEARFQDEDADGYGGPLLAASCAEGVSNSLDACDNDGAHWRGDSPAPPGSSPAALAAEMCPGTVLTLLEGTYPLDSDWVVDQSIQLQGSGPTTVIDAQGLFHIEIRQPLSLRDVTFRNGATVGSGGCLNASSATTLQNVNFEGCSASQRGGCIFSGGDLTLNNTSMLECSAGTEGGGAYATGNVTADGWLVQGATAPQDPLMNLSGNADILNGTFSDITTARDGLFVGPSASLSCTHCTFSDITLTGTSPSNGGIVNDGTILFEDVELSNVRATFNSAINNRGGTMVLRDFTSLSCPDCLTGFINRRGSVTWEGGAGQPPLTLDGDFSATNVVFNIGRLGVIGTTSMPRIENCQLDTPLTIQTSHGALLSQVSVHSNADTSAILTNSGSAPVVLDQVSVHATGNAPIRINGSGPFEIKDTVVEGASGSGITGFSNNLTVEYSYALGIDLIAPVIPASCTTCGTFSSTFANPPSDWSFVGDPVGLGSGEGCTAQSPPSCYDPGFLGGP